MVKNYIDDIYICPKCSEECHGYGKYMLGIMVCPDCSDKYEIELLPSLKKMVYEYFNVEYIESKDDNTMPSE